MNVKRILMFAVAAVISVAVGLAIINRAKRQFPQIGKVLGE